jgi:alpha-tubulin suppressor-like RCC1 family protein
VCHVHHEDCGGGGGRLGHGGGDSGGTGCDRAAPTAGRAAAWGSNIFGQLGDNSYTDSKVLVAVNTAGVLAGKTITAITAGDTHTCVVAEGRAYCWGNNSNGQLGDNTTTTSKVPVAVNGVLAGKTVTAITAGTRHSCAVADGKAYCWGYNSNGQLGNNTTADSSAPIAVNTTGVLAGRTVSAITAGGVHTCAVADGDAYCWGNNDFGQ